jgi:hypothetical protein
MRMCPKCRLITADAATCAECGWDLSATPPISGSLAGSYAARLQSLMIFSAVMFASGFVTAFSVTSADPTGPALAGGFFGAAIIADFFLLRLIYRAAELSQEAQRWTRGALLTFPFGTLVFAWLLAKRLREDNSVSRPVQ